MEFSDLELEQNKLILKFQQKEDDKIFKYFMDNYAGFIYKIVSRYVTQRVHLDDLIAEAHIGLLRAMRRYDPSKGHKFATYLVWWVKYYAWDYHQLNRRIGTTAAIRRINRVIKYLKDNNIDATIYTITEEQAKEYGRHLGISSETVYDAIFIMNTDEVSMSCTSDKNEQFLMDIPDDSPSAEDRLLLTCRDRQIKNLVNFGLSKLDDRQRYILQKRTLSEKDYKLSDLGTELGVSRERIRQIEKVALDKVTRAIAPYVENVL